MNLRSLIGLAIVLTACRPAPPQSTATTPEAADSALPSAPALATLQDTSTWVVWRTHGVTLRLPPGVAEVADTDRFAGFAGTALVWRFRDHQRLWLNTADVAPQGAGLPAYVDSLVTARNRVLDEDWRLEPARTITLGPHRVLELAPNCGDCVAYEDYFDFPTGYFIASYSLEQGQPYTYEEQEALYRAILGTVKPVSR